MDSLVKVFENIEFGKIRTIIIDENPWFVARDIAEALGYINGRDAIAKHVDDEDKGVAKCDTLGGKQDLQVINESGLFALVFGSKLSSAKKFKHWVTSEVLPTIRKTGVYKKPMSQLEILAAQANALVEQERKINELSQKQDQQEKTLQNIKEVAVYRPDNEWRDSTKKLINKMVDGDFTKIRDIRNEAYNLLESRMGVLLETRLRNKRRRLLEEGVSRTKANELNYLDVIADDKKLIEGFVAIIKEMSIKYGVAA